MQKISHRISNPSLLQLQLQHDILPQVKARPPTFALFCNTKELPGFFERYVRTCTRMHVMYVRRLVADRIVGEAGQVPTTSDNSSILRNV